MIDPVGIRQQLESLLQFGTIEEVQVAPLRYKVRFSSSRVSYWLRHGFARMAAAASWDPYQQGEQVLCALPGGGRHGVVLCAIDCDQHGQAEQRTSCLQRRLSNGDVIEHDSDTGNTSITVSGDLTITATGTVRINGQQVHLN